jgi:hypothetical protein
MARDIRLIAHQLVFQYINGKSLEGYNPDHPILADKIGLY